jgi:hypothetical protein
MHQRRQTPRTPIVEAAVVQAGDDLIECVVVEISRAGARIETSATLPHFFDLTLTGDRGQRRRSQLVWQEGHWAGVNFL